ncbi:hypothetical protein ACFGVS_15170 [Mucilaginibacter sp. AW1-7]|uniref:hypothetical protein n=1 Tax=Mucilaginibacter sp. AW1-7 TaxID=3349874 RepID=UPI003F73FC94
MNPFASKPTVSKRSAKKILAKDLIAQLKKGILPADINKNFLSRQIRYTLTHQEADRIISQLDESTYEFVFGKPIADGYENFTKEPGVHVEDLNAELLWIGRTIEEYADELTHFVSLEKEYSRCLLLGDYKKAGIIIDQIEQSISYSNWSLQQKLIIAEFEKGFKANKNLLSTLLSDDNSLVTNFISSYTSIRIEKNISPLQYDNILKDYMEAVDKSLHDFIRVKVDFFKTFAYEGYSAILNLESRQSIIDQFLAFKQVAKLLLCQKEVVTKHKIGTVKQIVRELHSLIPSDESLRVLGLMSDILPGFIPADRLFLDLADSYTVGNYKYVVEIAPDFIRANPSSYHAILLYVKACVNTGQRCIQFNKAGCIIDQLTFHLCKVLKKDDEFSFESFADAYKFVHQLGDHPLANGFFYLLTQELPFRFDAEWQINLFKFYVCSSVTLNPVLNQFLLPDDRQKFFDKLIGEKTESPTISLIRTIQATPVQVEDSNLSVRALKYLAITLRNKKQFQNALPLYDRIISSEEYHEMSRYSHYKLDILIGKYHCLFQLGDYKAAMELATSTLIQNENFQERFFVPPLLEELTGDYGSQLAGNIYLPIYLTFYRGNIESYDLYVAFDNYLDSKQVDRPSAYIKQLEEYTNLDICFLEKVCTHDVLHSSPAFENQEELDLERLEICNFLLGKSNNTTAIETEISELWRKILVRKGIKQINFSKIYVDVPGLKDLLRGQLRENFNRNIEIAALPLDQLQKIVDSLGNILVYYLERDDDQDMPVDQNDQQKVEENIKNLKLTSYSRFRHFKEAFLKIRDQFIENKDHGLDTYLSMRIRHGTLLGQIRSVFETHNLITVKNESGNEYFPNEYWITRFDQPELNDLLNETLGKFSKAIDELAERLKAETIQIKTEASKVSRGLFDYSYSEDELLKLFQEKFGAIKDFEAFMESGIEELWAKTEVGLAEIKKHLNGEMVSKLEAIFNEAETKLCTLSFKETEPAHEVLQDLISTLRKCQTAITVEMGNISEWFNRSNKKIIEEFDFKLLIDSNVDTLQNVNPLFAGAEIIKREDCDLILDGDLFPHFTDILYYLLENALKHSKLPSSELWIKIEVFQKDDRIHVKVSNNILDDDGHLATTRSNIAATKKKIESEKTYEDINKEGGTGFPKIKKTLKHDVKRKNFTIDLDLLMADGKPYFYTEISFETTNLPIINK